MKRLLDMVSAVLAVLVLALGWRVVQVLQVEPPTFAEPPQTAALETLPPIPRGSTPRGPEVDAIADGNLFEVERGYEEAGGEGEDAVAEEPLPPPTNVVLNGVFFQIAGRPMAIMTDTSSGNRQLTLQKGDNLGEYQVGEISRQRVVLLGRGGQEFSLELDIKKGGGGAPARTPPARSAARPAAAQPAARSAAAQRVSQTAAQRAAEARRQQAARARQAAANRRNAAQAAGEDRQSSTQARLEALRRLRDAARAR